MGHGYLVPSFMVGGFRRVEIFTFTKKFGL